MNERPGADLEPRKLPRQARSTVTVDAIFEATVQVLRTSGESGLTTTRVAERAGVSVGTLYQYFPHKNALLFAMLQRHMEAFAVALERACERHRGKAIEAIASEFAGSYVDLKVTRAEDRRLFYAAVTELRMDLVRTSLSNRIDLAVGRLLSSASDVAFDDAKQAASSLMRAMRGAAREAVDRPRDPAFFATLRGELSLFAQHHLSSVARGSAHPSRQIAIYGVLPARSKCE